MTKSASNCLLLDTSRGDLWSPNTYFELKGAENDQTRFKKEKVPEIAPNELSPASERVARRL
jgi:hypothetical protein